MPMPAKRALVAWLSTPQVVLNFGFPSSQPRPLASPRSPVSSPINVILGLARAGSFRAPDPGSSPVAALQVYPKELEVLLSWNSGRLLIGHLLRCRARG